MIFSKCWEKQNASDYISENKKGAFKNEYAIHNNGLGNESRFKEKQGRKK